MPRRRSENRTLLGIVQPPGMDSAGRRGRCNELKKQIVTLIVCGVAEIEPPAHGLD